MSNPASLASETHNNPLRNPLGKAQGLGLCGHLAVGVDLGARMADLSELFETADFHY